MKINAYIKQQKKLLAKLKKLRKAAERVAHLADKKCEAATNRHYDAMDRAASKVTRDKGIELSDAEKLLGIE